MDVRELGAFIQKRRKDLGMTQGELAAKLHVTDKAVSRWERGVGFPDIKLIEPLADALQVSVQELLQCQRILPENISNEITVDRKNGKLPCKWTLWITNHRGSLAAGFCLAYVIFDSLRQNPMFMPYQGWMSNVSMLLFLVVMCAFLYAAYRKEEKHGVF